MHRQTAYRIQKRGKKGGRPLHTYLGVMMSAVSHTGHKVTSMIMVMTGETNFSFPFPPFFSFVMMTKKKRIYCQSCGSSTGTPRRGGSTHFTSEASAFVKVVRIRTAYTLVSFASAGKRPAT